MTTFFQLTFQEVQDLPVGELIKLAKERKSLQAFNEGERLAKLAESDSSMPPCSAIREVFGDMATAYKEDLEILSEALFSSLKELATSEEVFVKLRAFADSCIVPTVKIQEIYTNAVVSEARRQIE